MPVNIAVSSPGEADIGALMQYLASNRVLLLLDNLDGVDNTVLSFLQHLPGPSRALVTARDARDLRLQIPHVWEVEHIGLTRDEMAELLQLWVKRSPTLGRKIGNATPEEVERLLIVSNGWPEAMVMLLTTLSNSLLHINELDEKVQQNIYDFILRGLYGGLDRTARATLVWTGSFPVTFTLDGLIQVSGLSRRSMEQAVTRLIGSHLIKEVLAGQYTWSHPIVREYAYGKAQSHVSSTLRQDKVETFLQTWTSQHGGQPKSDWSNFACLDREFENLKVLMERTATRKAYDVVTRIYRSLFSYIVERGYWTFTEAWCERMVAQRLRRSDLPDWLIWWSWIKYYLRHDFSASASLAEEALTLNPRGNRQRFEAHRRALMAQGQLGRSEAVAKHLEAAQDICRRSWNADSDEAIDLLNSNATAWLGIASATQVESMYEEALVVYERAERIAIRREDPNIREIGIAMLGQARCLRALGQVELALERTQSSLDYASRVSWLRGIAETNELVADLASRLGQFSLAESASELAEQTSRRLRAPTTIGLGGRE
jgi:tetratricopeptide (TPR) repeat protein